MEVVTPFKYDRTKEGGLGLIELGPELDPDKPFIPDIVECLKSGKPDVNGDVIKQKVKELGVCLGQRHAEYLLDHQELIPTEWRSMCLVFPGTVWEDLYYGFSDIPVLRWYDRYNEWRLGFSWLGPGWNSSTRLVKIKST